ncbi:GNAT family N-acetyltransferase [Streptomyces sp. M19]
MTDLGPVAWPPDPIRTERLVLRAPRAGDRAAFIELLASPEVGTYLGGPRPREELERAVPEVPGQRPGVRDRSRRSADRHGHARSARRGATGTPRSGRGEAELGYMFLPWAWGRGYATEACAAALGWFADVFPGEPVVLCTQTANGRSTRLAAKLGFTEVERFEEYGAEQWFGVWSPPTSPAPPTSPRTGEEP